MKSLKKFSLVVLLALFSANAFSQGTIYVKGGVVKGTPGGSGTIDIYLNSSDEKIGAISFDISLPAGVTLNTSKYDKYRNINSVTVGTSLILDGNPNLVSGDGLLLSLYVDYASDFAGGSAKFTEVAVSGTEDLYYEDVNFSFEVGTETVDITLANANSYNTYCCHKDLDVSGVTDAKFYVVSSVTASEATLTQVTNGIPAGEGFLIEGSGTANISVPVAASTPTATGSKLVGVTAATDIEAGNYILKSDGTSFIPCTAGTLPANKAYLKKDDVPASAKEFLMIVEDAVVTGINEVQAENSVNGPIYNLNGARVSNPQKGVYIMNGRKVIVK